MDGRSTASGGHFADGDHEMQVRLDWWNFDAEWYAYAVGYRRAIEALGASVEEESATDRGTLIFPLGALCRHAIELALKRLLVHLHESYAEAESFRATHNIIGLWNAARDPLARLDLCAPELDRRVRRALEPFAELDRSGVVFRYPVTSDGSAVITQEHLNIGAMRDAALALLNDLEALADAVARDTELRYEAMLDAAQAWWYGLSDEEREEYEHYEAEVREAYLEGHI